MPVGAVWRGLVAATLFAVAALGLGQAFRVPEGSRHYIVLVDSTHSMIRDMRRPATGAKRRALQSASAALTDSLFEGSGPLQKSLPRYRKGTDLISVLQFGRDTRSDADQAYTRLSSAALGNDYMRRVEFAATDLTARQFRNALIPKKRTNLNALAWAIPLGMRDAAAPKAAVQDTYVILLFDAQMNAGSIALERHMLGIWLGREGHAALRKADTHLSNHVALGEPVVSEPFGSAPNTVWVTAYRPRSLDSVRRAEQLQSLRPLEDADVRWSGGKLEVRVGLPDQLPKSNATMELRAGGKTYKSSGTDPFKFAIPASLAGERAKLTLLPQVSSANPILGTQKIRVAFDEPVILPARPDAVLSLLRTLGYLVLATLISGAIWAYRHLFLARHLMLRLPGYARPFDLSPTAQQRQERFVVRRPLWNGDEAMTVLLPPTWLRKLFYKDATLAWDPKLGTDATEASEISFLEAPTALRLTWADRLPTETVARVEVNRRLPLGVGHVHIIEVRYSALPPTPADRQLTHDELPLHRNPELAPEPTR